MHPLCFEQGIDLVEAFCAPQPLSAVQLGEGTP